MSDLLQEIEAVQRSVGTKPVAAGDARVVQLSRTYDAPIDDVWDALTNAGRIGRWFLPITGDLKLGGHSSWREMPAARFSNAMSRTGFA